jgi:hypothetical protein
LVSACPDGSPTTTTPFARTAPSGTAERICDKIREFKARGMWMGGKVPLGYAVRDRKLVIVPE